MSATELQRQGRQAYKDGDFPKALQYFNRALGRQQTVTLYDNRAATHIKLRNLPAALDDAKRIIQTGHGDPTGYFRAGKVLIKMDKESTALEIYRRGLRNVRHVGRGYEELKRVHDEMQAKLSPRNSVDPLTLLPRELAITVLEYLSFRQMIAICRVSKGWQTFIRSEPTLWQHLDLSMARCKVRSSFISLAINTAKSKMRAVTLNKLYDFDKVLTSLARHVPLETLVLADTGLQSDNLIKDLDKAGKLKEIRIQNGTRIGQATLRTLASQFHDRLEVLQCDAAPGIIFSDGWAKLKLPWLRCLSLSGGDIGGIDDGLNDLIGTMPALESLTLHTSSLTTVQGDRFQLIDLRPCARLSNLDLQLVLRSARQLRLPESIRTLRLCNTGSISSVPFWSDEVDDFQLWNLPRLETLHVELPSLMLEDLHRRLGGPPFPSPDRSLSKLRSLYVGRAQNLVELNTPRLLDLEDLVLRGGDQLKDGEISTAIQHLKKLRSLNLTGSAITGVGVKDIVQQGVVEELVLNDCRELARDAVDWARSQGIKVECRRQEDIGGKRVRY